MRKINIIILLSYYYPAYKAGGPITSIKALVERLGDEFGFYIITSNHDIDNKTPFENVVSDTWINVGKAKVYYGDFTGLKCLNMIKIINNINYDVLYLNSYFDIMFSILPSFYKRYGLIKPSKTIIAPKGEFSRGALKIKYIKKKLFIMLSNVIKLRRDIIWQASSEFEVLDIQRIQYKLKNSTIIAHDITNAKNDLCNYSNEHNKIKQKNSITITFVSRISKMKNLEFALMLLAKIKLPIIFDIYGPINSNDNYAKGCINKIKTLPPNISATYKGTLKPEEVIETISSYDLFFLPTMGENFGHVIYESLTAHTPVLISDQTPWSMEVQQNNVGWAFPLNEQEKFAEVIEKVFYMDNIKYQKIVNNIKNYLVNSNLVNDSVKQNRNLFLS